MSSRIDAECHVRPEHFIIGWGMFVFSSLVVFTLKVLGPCTLGQGSRQPSRLDLLEIDEKLHLDEILVSLHSRCISAKQPLRSPQGESACISLNDPMYAKAAEMHGHDASVRTYIKMAAAQAYGTCTPV